MLNLTELLNNETLNTSLSKTKEIAPEILQNNNMYVPYFIISATIICIAILFGGIYIITEKIFKKNRIRNSDNEPV